MLMYNWSLHHAGTFGLFVAFLYVAAGAVRLARFNVLSMAPDGGTPKKSNKFFLGLPIPAAAGVIVSLVVANHGATTKLESESYLWSMMGLTFCLGVLMTSNVRFRSFKKVRFDIPTVLLAMFVVGSSVGVAAQFGGAFVLFWLGCVYLSVGMIESAIGLPRRIRAERKSTPPT